MRRRQFAVEQLAGVGSAHAAGLARAVQREGVELDVRKPEALFDRGAQLSRALPPSSCRVAVAAALCKRGHRAQCGIDIALHFDERDRPLGEAAVGMKYRIDAVLPSLVGETGRACGRVIDEAVAI